MHVVAHVPRAGVRSGPRLLRRLRRRCRLRSRARVQRRRIVRHAAAAELPSRWARARPARRRGPARRARPEKTASCSAMPCACLSTTARARRSKRAVASVNALRGARGASSRDVRWARRAPPCARTTARSWPRGRASLRRAWILARACPGPAYAPARVVRPARLVRCGARPRASSKRSRRAPRVVVRCPAPTETVACGDRCGTQERSCSAERLWEYGPCTGEGACVPGTMEMLACGNCGTQPARCSETCELSATGRVPGRGRVRTRRDRVHRGRVSGDRVAPRDV